MRILFRRFLLLACGLLPVFAGCRTSGPRAPAYEIVVYGGTSAGVAAAVHAARQGRTVVLIEPGRHLGGLSSGGLGMTDTGDRSGIGGVSREFYQRVKRHYDGARAWRQQERMNFRFYRPDDDAMWRFEPHVAEAVFRAMIRDAGVPVVFGERLDLEGGVRRWGDRLTALVMESGREFRGRVFLDATYEGDLMAKAGVTYVVGREANSRYGETLNGVQTRRATKHQFLQPIDPFVVPGAPASGLLPGVQPEGPGVEAEGDHRVQAYCFRMCTTDVAANRVPFPRPEGYDAGRYKLLLRYLQAPGPHKLWHPAAMPNRKTDTNNNGPFSTDHIGANYDYPEGDYETRDRIVADHVRYQQGLMWFLANDPRVPEAVQAPFRTWGLAKDEFVDNEHWPHQLYIREARRMVGEYVNTERDCRRQRVTPRPVGLGSYNMDSHNVQRYVDAAGHVRNEGDIQVSPGGPYAISYGAIVPRRAECTNLLVPVCLSASHAAYGSIRMEPVFMILGHSAAAAAHLAIELDVDVQAVPYAELRRDLLAAGQVLDLPR